MDYTKSDLMWDMDLHIELKKDKDKVMLHLTYGDGDILLNPIPLDNKPNVWAVVELLNAMSDPDLELRKRVTKFILKCHSDIPTIADAHHYNLDFILRVLSTRYIKDDELWELTIPVTLNCAELVDDMPILLFKHINIPDNCYNLELECVKSFTDYLNGDYHIILVKPNKGNVRTIGSMILPLREALCRIVVAGQKDIKLRRVFDASEYLPGIANMMNILISVMNSNAVTC